MQFHRIEKRQRSLFIVGLLISVIDGPLFFRLHELLNPILISARSARIIEVSPAALLLLQLLQCGFLAVAMLLFQRFQQRKALVIMGLLLGLLALRMVVIGHDALSAPVDRIRVKRTGARVQILGQELEAEYKTTGVLRRNLYGLSEPTIDLYDEWGCRLEYVVDDDGLGYSLFSRCLPERLSWMEREYQLCSLKVRLNGESQKAAVSTVK